MLGARVCLVGCGCRRRVFRFWVREWEGGREATEIEGVMAAVHPRCTGMELSRLHGTAASCSVDMVPCRQHWRKVLMPHCMVRSHVGPRRDRPA